MTKALPTTMVVGRCTSGGVKAQMLLRQTNESLKHSDEVGIAFVTTPSSTWGACGLWAWSVGVVYNSNYFTFERRSSSELLITRVQQKASPIHRIVTHLKFTRDSSSVTKPTSLSTSHINMLPVITNGKKANETSALEYFSHYNLSNTFGKAFFSANEDCRATTLRIRRQLQLAGDVEENPGPIPDKDNKASIKVMTYNVRGLNDEKKLRHLINSCYNINAKSGKNCDIMYLFQETYITEPGKIPYLWRGNYKLTRGMGNSLGCLTLLSNHINIIASEEIDVRAHVLVCQVTGEQGVSYIIANAYAPCPNTQEKISFFENFFDKISELSDRYDCDKIILGGDLNLNLRDMEMKNRIYSTQEKRVADIVKTYMSNLDLIDVWSSRNCRLFTWRRPNSEIFSTIDRVGVSKDRFDILKTYTDWSVSLSDHAAVIVELGHKNIRPKNRTRLVRLDPFLMRYE